MAIFNSGKCCASVTHQEANMRIKISEFLNRVSHKDVNIFVTRYVKQAHFTLQWRHNGCYDVSITSLPIVYSAVYAGADQRKHQSSASLDFVRGIHQSPVNSTHIWPITRNMFRFDDVVMMCKISTQDANQLIAALITFIQCRKAWRQHTRHCSLVAVHTSLVKWSSRQLRWRGWVHSTALQDAPVSKVLNFGNYTQCGSAVLVMFTACFLLR